MAISLAVNFSRLHILNTNLLVQLNIFLELPQKRNASDTGTVTFEHSQFSK